MGLFRTYAQYGQDHGQVIGFDHLKANGHLASIDPKLIAGVPSESAADRYRGLYRDSTGLHQKFLDELMAKVDSSAVSDPTKDWPLGDARPKPAWKVAVVVPAGRH